MNYLKYTQYIYLIAAVFFIYKGITLLNNGTDMAYIAFGMAILAFVMFFFRRFYAQKFNNTKK